MIIYISTDDDHGSVVRKADSAFHRIVIFSTVPERHKKTMTPDIFNSQEIRNSNSKILNFDMEKI